jgi:hypothetical protein
MTNNRTRNINVAPQFGGGSLRNGPSDTGPA